MENRLYGIAAKSSRFVAGNLSLGRKPLAYVGGWLGQKNLGDEALFEASGRIFRQFSLWHFDGSRTMTSLMRIFPLSGCGLFAGGTLINRCSEYLEIAERFLNNGRQLIVFGTGVAHPDFWQRRADFRNQIMEWKGLLERCSYVGVRGPVSAELLMDAGLEDVEVVGDPVIAFAEDQPASEITTNSLGVNIGYDHGNQWGDERIFAQNVLTLVKLAKMANWRIKWFVVFPRDLEVTERLAKESGTEENICCVYENSARYLAEVRSMSVFIGMKLHATMLATCAYVPSLMLEYDPKCLDFMKSINQGDAVMRTDKFSPELAWEMLKAWNLDRQARSQAIFTSVQSLKRLQNTRALELSGKMISGNLSKKVLANGHHS